MNIGLKVSGEMQKKSNWRKKQLLKNRLKNILQNIWTDVCEGKNIENKFVIEEPPKNIDADFASNVCFLGSKLLEPRTSPIKIAEIFIQKINESSEAKNFINKVFIAGAGFLNFELNKTAFVDEFIVANNDKENYFKLTDGKNKRVLVEFVSANPTGPLHIGHARGAVIGDSLARVLTKAGYEVDKEYYVNDAGNQMAVLGQSLEIRYTQLLGENIELPANCYQGEYITEIAKNLIKNNPTKNIKDFDFKQIALDDILEIIKNDLRKFNIEFTNWFLETSLCKSKDNEKSALDDAIEILKEKKHAQVIDGALWLMTNETGDDDKNRVIVRSDGRPTYFATDIAYHKNKFDRGYDKMIDIWGADHHGYVARLKASIGYLGKDTQKLNIILYHLVSLMRNGEKVAMSTRSGEFICLNEVIDEVGADATRFFLLMRDGNSPLDFDLELAKKKSSENPVYYVQYAHARINSIIKNATENNILMDEKIVIKNLAQLLNTKEDLVMIKTIFNYTDVLKVCVRDLSSHHISGYLLDLAGKFHNYYAKHKIVDKENIELSSARILLCKNIAYVLKDGLYVLGVSAPENM
jgi:arginyl-tRNA synthetase